MEIVQANYSDLDAWAKQYNKKTSVEVLEDMIRNKIISYLSGYELCHKMYKIATKSGLQATRTGRKLYIGLEYNGKKYPIDYIYDSNKGCLQFIIQHLEVKTTEEPGGALFVPFSETVSILSLQKELEVLLSGMKHHKQQNM